jgi:uncharacterized protein
MTLTDTGPLVAMIDRKDAYSVRCWTVVRTLPKPLVTTWPCLTEATYQLGKVGQWYLVNALWSLVDQGILIVHHPDDNELRRVWDLMKTYRDLPCDLADASLIAAAETLGLRRIFTLDSHFYAYRLADSTALEIMPS